MFHGSVRLTAAPPMQADQATGGTEAAADLEELLDAISDVGLDGKDADFVSDMRERLSKYGSKAFCSEKQRAWLKRLASGDKQSKRVEW